MNAVRLLAFALFTTLGVNSMANPIRGAGVWPCSEWTRAQATGDVTRALQQLQWFLGFVSSYNHFVMRGTAGAPAEGAFPVDPDAVPPWLDDWCRRNPGYDLYYAGQALIREQTSRK